MSLKNFGNDEKKYRYIRLVFVHHDERNLLYIYASSNHPCSIIMIYYMKKSQITYLRPFFVDCGVCCCFRLCLV